MSIKVIRYRPAYFSGFKEESEKVSSTEELFNIPWIDENVKINGSKKQCKICREISIKKYNQGKRNKKLQIK